MSDLVIYSNDKLILLRRVYDFITGNNQAKIIFPKETKWFLPQQDNHFSNLR